MLSESFLKEALQLTQRDLRPQHPQMMRELNGLGVLYTSMNKRKQAETNFKKAISIAENFGSEAADLAPVLGDMALFYEHQRKWRLAEPLLIGALRIAERSLGAAHPETAAILTALGFLYYRQGKLVESERILRRSLDIRRKTFGPTHSSVALTSLIIAGVLTAKGQYEEAKLLYADSLQAEEQNFGPRSPEVATTLEEFSMLLHKINNHEEAFAMEARAKSIRAEIEYVVRPGPKTIIGKNATHRFSRRVGTGPQFDR
jgi:tetratricopeptide (TPR) repeat protein